MMNKLWTIGALLTWTTQFFTSKGIDSPRLDAEILLSHVLNKERIYLYAHYDEPMTTEELAAYRELVKYCVTVIVTAPILCIYPFLQKYFVNFLFRSCGDKEINGDGNK